MADFSCIPFSFCRNGEPVAASAARQETFSSVTEGDKRLTKTIFHFADGLNVTQSVTEYLRFGATYRRLQWHYTGEQNSATYSQLMDADFEISAGAITRCTGDRAADRNFASVTETPEDGQTLSYAADTGRATWFEAPYYDIAQPDGGLIMTIGWAGAWRASFTCNGDRMRVTAGVDGVETYFKPDEAFHTASILLLPYTGDRDVAHNVFRRLLKEEFSLLGQPGRATEEPICEATLGGYPHYRHKEIIDAVHQNLPQVECYWVDACWFGNDPIENHTELVLDGGEGEGDCYIEGGYRWFQFVGDWQANPHRYPNGLEEISTYAKQRGFKFLLWLESERCVFRPDFPKKHPERYLFRKDPELNKYFWSFKLDEGFEQGLLNLGCPAGLEQAKQSAFSVIDRYGVDILRQDFNVIPVPYWQENDEEGRVGMCQVHYINGLYALWDAILERYPHILIENCAGGGTRLEIEMMRRSINMWRSDYHHMSMVTRQFQTEALTWWIPYYGSYMESVIHEDPDRQVYSCRSCYAPALVGNFFTRKEEEYARMSKILDEYISVRPFMYEDYYPVFGQTLTEDDWGGWQFDRSAQGDGILMAFCREEAPLQTTVKLKGLCADATYALTDRDSGNVVTATGCELMENGLPLAVPKTRTSLLIEYKKI